jgi:hypothetical protein
MKKLQILVLITTCLSSLNASAFDRPSDSLAEASRALAATGGDDPALSDEAVGQTAIQWGNDWTGTNLFERAAAADPTILNRFNLAAAYQKTGRLERALTIYHALEKDGQYTWLISIPEYSQPDWVVRFNVAEESARRISELAPDRGAHKSHATVADIASDPRSHEQISDSQAIALDAQRARSFPIPTSSLH